MILDKIGGYWVTDDPNVLDAFLVQARERYTAIEQALEPIAATVSDLERDWKPRWEAYWKRKLTALLSLRAATHATFQLFDREQNSRENPVPAMFYETNVCYTIPLRLVLNKIEEAGILLTSYIEVSNSHQEQHLRQRQRVLKALQKVVSSVREVIGKGHAELDRATQEQKKLLTPRRTRRSKQKATPASTTDDAETAEGQPSLHVVRAEEVQ